MQVDAIIKKCATFICEYLPLNPSLSSLLEYVYIYDMGISPEEIILKVKTRLESVFLEQIEQYVFLRTPFEQLLTIISNRELCASNEYSIVKCVVMWVLHDVENRLQHSERLLEFVDYALCSKSIMLDNRPINTNVPLLDKLLQQCHIKISILNDTCTRSLIKQYNVQNINNIKVPRDVFRELPVEIPVVPIIVPVVPVVPVVITRCIKPMPKTLCHVSEDGIFITATNRRLMHYNFGEVDKVIYASNDEIFIFSFSERMMYKYRIAKRRVVMCRYPTYSEFDYSTSIDLMSDGQLIAIGGKIPDRGYSKVVYYYDVTGDSWTLGCNVPVFIRLSCNCSSWRLHSYYWWC